MALAQPLVTCADPLSGFFAADRRLLPAPERLRPGGYKIALELMVRGRLRVTEVPIVFHDRCIGSSKMSWRTLVAYLRQLSSLYRFHLAGCPKGARHHLENRRWSWWRLQTGDSLGKDDIVRFEDAYGRADA